jgi:hypothetical protein
MVKQLDITNTFDIQGHIERGDKNKQGRSSKVVTMPVFANVLLFVCMYIKKNVDVWSLDVVY